MLKRRGWLGLAVLVTSMSMLVQASNAKELDSAPVAATKTVTFIHLNDLHAHLTTHSDLVRYGETEKLEQRGGMPRLATLIKRLRAQYPDSVLMNVGDAFHGGVEALFTNGNAIIDPVNALGIDVGVVGNWDYAYGPIVTRSRYGDLKSMGLFTDSKIKRPNYPNLAANLKISLPFFRRGDYLMPPTMTMMVGGVKIGFIGITSDIVPRMHPMLAFGLNFLDFDVQRYSELIEKHAAELRQNGAQVVVVMSELGIHKDYALANHIAPHLVDVFFSAHTHEVVRKPLESSSGALVVESGGGGGYLGRMNVTVQNGHVIRRDWFLYDVDTKIPEDATMKSLVAIARAPFLGDHVNVKLPSMAADIRLTQSIDTVVGYTGVPLDRRNALESTFNDVMADMMRKLGKTQVAITPGFRFDSPIAASGELFEDNTIANGAITLEDVYRYFPVPYLVATGSIRGDKLRQAMEMNLTSVFSTDMSLQSGGWADGWSGLKVKLDLAHPNGSRIIDLQLKDEARPLSPDEMVTVTGCSRPFDSKSDTTLCSYDGFESVDALINPVTGKQWTAVDLFVYGLHNGLLDTQTRHDVEDVHHTKMWPRNEYVQPLQGVGNGGE
ncbi:MAG: bifunctional metallophosphatase/5'-nucleotidase [Sulfuriferula sp.]|nr:bifunctional metallophosphatase/5'-nucleotidase [Sulfuriferula sp.]